MNDILEFIKSKIVLTIFTLVFPVFLFAQYSAPSMTGNNGTSDITFLDCASLTTLSFTTGYPFQYINGKYTWTLYLNGSQVDQQTQLLLHNSCSPTVAELPYVNFLESPQSGNFQIRLEIKKYQFVSIGCTGFWVPYANGPDLWSNIIHVSRPDDGYLCNCNTPIDYTVPCGSMLLIQSFGAPYNLRTSHDITISCTNFPGKTANLTAEHAIHLIPPFHAYNGSHFHAVIDPCDFHRSFIPFGTTDSGDTDAENDSTSMSNSDVAANIQQVIEDDKVLVFPNPNNGVFTLERSTSEAVSIYVYDLLGKIVYQNPKFQETILSIDISNQHSGVYFLKIVSENNMVVKRIVFN